MDDKLVLGFHVSIHSFVRITKTPFSTYCYLCVDSRDENRFGRSRMLKKADCKTILEAQVKSKGRIVSGKFTLTAEQFVKFIDTPFHKVVKI